MNSVSIHVSNAMVPEEDPKTLRNLLNSVDDQLNDILKVTKGNEKIN